MEPTAKIDPPPPAPAPVPAGSGVTWLAWAVSAVAVVGSLYLSIGLKLEACPLCFYQRTFVLSVLGVLSVGLMAGMNRAVPLSLLVLPLASAALALAGFHVNLERVGKLECPAG